MDLMMMRDETQAEMGVLEGGIELMVHLLLLFVTLILLMVLELLEKRNVMMVIMKMEMGEQLWEPLKINGHELKMPMIRVFALGCEEMEN